MTIHNPTTFELIQAAAVLVQALTEDHGELDERSEHLLEIFMERCPDKLGALKAVVDRSAADADFLKAEAKRLDERRGGLLKIRERCRLMARELLEAHQDLTGETKIKTPTYTAYLSTRHSVAGPSDPEEWPELYREEVTTIKPNKKAALAALKGGAVVPGLELASSVSVAFR